MRMIEPSKVDLGGEISRKFYLTIHGNLLKLDVDGDFVKPFEVKDGEYIGIGLLLSATAYFYAYSKLERVLAIRNKLLNSIINAQDPDGYVGYNTGANRTWRIFDSEEISAIIMGLIDDYKVFGESRSLDAVNKLYKYLLNELRNHPEKRPAEEQIKFDDSMAFNTTLFALLRVHDEIAKDKAIIDFLVETRKLPEWDAPIVLGRWGGLVSHAEAYLATCLAQLKLFHFHPDSKLLSQSKKLIDFLLNGDGMVVTGGVSERECWHNTQNGGWGLSETCASSYLLLLLTELVELDNKPLYGDIMERVIYNTFFAAQSADGRRLRYYTSMEGKRHYWSTDSYCCPGSFRKTMSSLAELICFYSDNNIYINLYNSGTYVTSPKKNEDVRVVVDTEYPTSGNVLIRIELEDPASFDLNLRIPLWCKKAALFVNGQSHAISPPDKYTVISRKWEKGDSINLKMDMPTRFVKGRKNQDGKVAIMRGPMVYCLNVDGDTSLLDANLDELVIDPASIEGPFSDDSLRKGGTSIKIKGWKGTMHQNIPQTKTNYNLIPTEFIDPQGIKTYFKVPNPEDPLFEEDELTNISQ